MKAPSAWIYPEAMRCGDVVSPENRDGDWQTPDGVDFIPGVPLYAVDLAAIEAALVRLTALEDNAANLARWEQLQREVSG